MEGIDLTKQTITLGKDQPDVSLTKGHVKGEEFLRRFRAEGWDASASGEFTKQEIEAEEAELEYKWGKPWKNGWRWDLTPTDQGAEPVTIRRW